MLELILAQGTAEAIGIAVGSAVVVLTGGKGLAVLASKRKNGNAFNKELCEERHRNIGTQLEKMDVKLDKIIDHQAGR